MGAGQVVLAAGAHELLARPGQRAAGQVVGHHLVAEHVAGRHAQLGGEEAGEPAGLGVAERPDGHDMLLGVQLQPVGAQAAVEVDGELRDPQHRPVHPQQPQLRAGAGAHGHAAGQPQVAVEPGIQDGPAVDLHAELPEARPAGVGPRLHPERRAVGVGAEQPEARVRRAALRDDPGQQRPAVGHDVAAGPGGPPARQADLGEAGLGQPAAGLGGGVIRGRRRVEEPDQVQGGVAGGVHVPILARPSDRQVRGISSGRPAALTMNSHRLSRASPRRLK